jgi:hypothetical protein
MRPTPILRRVAPFERAAITYFATEIILPSVPLRTPSNPALGPVVLKAGVVRDLTIERFVSAAARVNDRLFHCLAA